MIESRWRKIRDLRGESGEAQLNESRVKGQFVRRMFRLALPNIARPEEITPTNDPAAIADLL